MPEFNIALVLVRVLQDIQSSSSPLYPLRFGAPFLFSLFPYFSLYTYPFVCVGSAVPDCDPHGFDSNHRALVLAFCWFHRALVCGRAVAGFFAIERQEGIVLRL